MEKEMYQIQNSTVIESRVQEKKYSRMYISSQIVITRLKFFFIFSIKLKSTLIKIQDEQRRKPQSLNNTWKRNGLIILFYIKKAIQRFLSYSKNYKFRRLEKRHFRIIDDVSVRYSYYQVNGHLAQSMTIFSESVYYLMMIVTKISSRFPSYIRINFIILPDSQTKIIIDLFILLMLILIIIIVPIRLAFTQELKLFENETAVNIYDFAIISVMILMVIVNFLTAFYKKGELITKPKKVLLNYFKIGFLLDLPIIILFLLAVIMDWKYLETVILIKTLQISSIVKSIEENFQLKERSIIIIDLIMLTMKILVIAHIFGCTFYFINKMEIEAQSETTWVNKIGMAGYSWLEKYISSLYWAVVTMVTLGYGDIVPTTMVQRIYVIVMALISCGVFGYSINHIGNIFAKIEEKDKEKSKEIGLITTYLRDRNLDRNLLMQCRRYIQYLNDQNDNHEECEKLINKLGGDLKRHVKRDIYFKLVTSSKLLSLNFSREFLLNMSDYFSEKRYGPDDIIYKENEVNDKLYFLVGGDIELKIKIKNIRKVKLGEVFGKYSFISNQAEKTAAVCRNIVSLAYITRDDFIITLKKFPQDYQQFCHLRDSLTINLNSQGLDISCIACQSFNHEFINCHLLTYQTNKEKYLYQINKSITQERRAIKRRKFRSSKPTIYIDEAHEAAAQLLIDIDYYADIVDLEQCVNNIQNVRLRDQSFDLISEQNRDLEIDSEQFRIEEIVMEETPIPFIPETKLINKKVAFNLEKSYNSLQNNPGGYMNYIGNNHISIFQVKSIDSPINRPTQSSLKKVDSPDISPMFQLKSQQDQPQIEPYKEEITVQTPQSQTSIYRRKDLHSKKKIDISHDYSNISFSMNQDESMDGQENIGDSSRIQLDQKQDVLSIQFRSNENQKSDDSNISPEEKQIKPLFGGSHEQNYNQSYENKRISIDSQWTQTHPRSSVSSITQKKDNRESYNNLAQILEIKNSFEIDQMHLWSTYMINNNLPTVLNFQGFQKFNNLTQNTQTANTQNDDQISPDTVKSKLKHQLLETKRKRIQSMGSHLDKEEDGRKHDINQSDILSNYLISKPTPRRLNDSNRIQLDVSKLSVHPMTERRNLMDKSNIADDKNGNSIQNFPSEEEPNLKLVKQNQKNL